MKNIIILVGFVFMMLMPMAFAQLENDDPSVFGFEIEKLLNLGSGILAAILFALTLIAYRRTKRKRMLYVSIAFFLFSVKGFITSPELISLDLAWIDSVASFLNFAILLAFFFGIVKR